MPGTAGQTLMTRPRGRPRKSERNDRTVKLDSQLVGLAEMVARFENVSLAEYLSETLRGPVTKDFGRVMKAIEAKGEKKE